MKRQFGIKHLYQGLVAITLIGTGLFALYNLAPQQHPTALAILQQLSHPNVAVVAPELFIQHLRQLKTVLVQTPEIKQIGLNANFGWKRDVFDPLRDQFSQVLQQKADDSQLSKILSLTDSAADEFEESAAGTFYNAETDGAARAWRDAMYYAAQEAMPNASALRTFMPSSQAPVLQQKFDLKNKKPRQKAQSTGRNSSSSKHEDSPVTQYDGTPDNAEPHGYDYDDLLDEDFLNEVPEAYPLDYSTSGQQNLPMQTTPMPVAKDDKKSTIVAPESTSPTSSNNNGFAVQPLGIDNPDTAPIDYSDAQAAAKLEIQELQRFMAEFQASAPARNRKNINEYKKIIAAQYR